jgi:hypothetical protein
MIIQPLRVILSSRRLRVIGALHDDRVHQRSHLRKQLVMILITTCGTVTARCMRR